MSIEENLNVNIDISVIDDLESGRYLTPEFSKKFKNEVRMKIEEFSQWFNSTAQLYLLKCDSSEWEMYVFLLLNLKKKLKFALSTMNKSVIKRKQSFICNICEEEIEIEPFRDVWSGLQDHSHFEESYSNALEVVDLPFDQILENGDSSTSNESTDDLNDELDQLVLNEPEKTANTSKPQAQGVNDFKFNFTIKYDKKIEESLYPKGLVQLAHQSDCLADYTVQRRGVNRGVCLLCPCNLNSIKKLKPNIIKSHISGQRHLKSASTTVNTSALKEYHEFWHGQEPCYQAHQIYFLPEIIPTSTCRCQLCQERLPYNLVVGHIKDRKHQNAILKISNSPERWNEFYLLDMQLEIYGVGFKYPKKEETNQQQASGPACVFSKFIVDPTTINLPPRHKDHLQFFIKQADSVFCKLCKIKFQNSNSFITNHISNAQHRQLSGIPASKCLYFCEICNLYLKDEEKWNEHFIKGPNRHNTMSEGRKQKVTEYECKTCMVVIFGDELSLSRHIKSRARAKKQEIRLPPTVKKAFKCKAYIEEEAQRLTTEAAQVFENQDKMRDCCKDLENALSGIYPNCKAYPFGSRISGLGNHQSDLDIFMDIGDMYLGGKYQDSLIQEQFVKRASKALKSCREDFAAVVSIPSARTPIVKVHHIYTKLDCDVSFRHGLGVENTKFLRFCIDLQPVTQPFILLLKRWSGHCKINEHITNYGLALMAIFFLQTRGHLLSVKKLRNYNPATSLVIDGWDTIIYTVPIKKMKEFVTPCTSSIKDLLRDFFDYFSKFDYTNNVICPLLGYTIPKLLFNDKPNGEGLPIEMKTYVNRIKSENGEQFRSLTPFCIQDPFDLSHNLTKACQQGTINKLKAFCTLTYEFLDTIE